MSDDSQSDSITVAQPPFDRKTADVVLRTSDQVDFYVRKGILAEASMIFEDMFGIAQGGNVNGESVTPVISMTENSCTIDFLLRVYYPVDNSQLETGEDALSALEAARKYMMDYAMKEAKKQFIIHAEKEPLRMYAIACSRGLHEEMRMAAKASLSRPLEDSHEYVKELDDISANAYLRLRDYHRRCCKVAGSLHYSDTTLGTRGWSRSAFSKTSFNPDRLWERQYTEWARKILQKQPSAAVIASPDTTYAFLTEDNAGRALSHIHLDRLRREIGVFVKQFAEAIDSVVETVRDTYSLEKSWR